MLTSYFITHNVLTPKECQTVIDHCSSRCKTSSILGLNDDGFQDKTYRNSLNTFLTKSDHQMLPMIQKVIDNVVRKSDEYFKFPIGFIEDIQYAEYTKGMYYKEHMDSGDTLKFDRDISASVILSPRNEYDEGNLCIRQTYSGEFIDVEERQGDVILFSSMLSHQVKEVKNGKRCSLVLWCKRPNIVAKYD